MAINYLEIKKQIRQKLSKPIDFEDTDNLLELGLSSLVIMKLVNQWRKQGIKISFGVLMEHPTLREWWELIQKTLEKADSKKRTAKKEKRIMADMYQEFPLTDVQYAYWVGRDERQALGGIGCHAYLEFDGKAVDQSRLRHAWAVVQQHHPMLRACFLNNGAQKILAKPYKGELKINDYSSMQEEEAQRAALSIRNRLSHRKLHIEKGEVAGLELTLLPHGKTRLHIDVDLLVADVQSLHKYKRSVTRMIHALSREGFLHKEADIYYLTRNADILLERKKLWEQFEYYESIIKYSRKYFAYQKKAGNSILEQLREEINALNLFFPEGGTDVALSAYKDNLINEALNKVISFLVNESIQLKKKVKILEVGAGVGGTTIPVITNLVHHDITYCFTDISKFFLNNARKNFEDYDFMEYKLFDINMNFEEQGFYEDSYDLIICANVLHNSKNIPEVLGKLKHLLKSEGKLLIIEATKESYALLTSLELKGGLDQFTDDRRDNDIIFNSKHSWEEKLKVSGFNVKFILPSDEDTIAENGQTIFFCTKGDNAFNITENYIKTFLKERLPEYMIPRNIRFMENIPLNVNNKIDRRLLLTMSQSIRETKMTLTNLEEKENLNQNEKIISSIWKEILGIEYVNKKDNFYSVGGDSLLIAQVVTKMRKSIKQLENISWDQLMREVLENPTLEGMSNIISQKEHSIQKMQKTSMSKYIHKYNETENAPVKVISFFHAGTGRLIDYKHMVENLLDKDMSDTQLIGFTYGEYQQYMETPVESLVQDRANLYAETLLEFNVDRYTLVGYCVGGFLALETAKILLENGKKVKLIMIDSRLCQHTISNQLLMEYAYGLSMELDMDNTPYSIKPVMLKEALEKILNGENRNIKNSELTKLSDEYAELGEVFTNLLDMTHEERIKALFNSKKQHNFNGEESTISMLNLLYDIYEHTFNAMMRYRPEGIYSGDITYINATEGIVNFYPDTNVATTWEDMVLGEFKIVNIYANHASIVGAEHSKEILPYIE